MILYMFFKYNEVISLTTWIGKSLLILTPIDRKLDLATCNLTFGTSSINPLFPVFCSCSDSEKFLQFFFYNVSIAKMILDF